MENAVAHLKRKFINFTESHTYSRCTHPLIVTLKTSGILLPYEKIMVSCLTAFILLFQSLMHIHFSLHVRIHATFECSINKIYHALLIFI